MKGLFILDTFRLIYNEETEQKIRSKVDILGPVFHSKDQIPEEILRECDIIFSGWNAPLMDSDFLQKAPNLKIVFYGAGTVKYFITDSFWERNIRICSAWAANAIPVAEYTLSAILFSLKCGFAHANKYMHSRGAEKYKVQLPGAYKSCVGIISAGMIGKKVIDLLKAFDVNIKVYDPYLSKSEADRMNVTLCSLQELFQSSDVLSVHTPLTEETKGLITGDLFRSMKQGATLINTARGAVINEAELLEVLKERQDIFAVLDVTTEEPLNKDSGLWDLNNILITPHIAGSSGAECARHGEYMYEECIRFLNEQPLLWEVNKKMLEKMA